MKLRKLPNKLETRVVIRKFMSIDGVRVELPPDADKLFDDLNDTTYPTDLVRIYDKELIKALMDCGLIRNGSRGSRTDAVIANCKYYCTEKFRKHYPQLKKKVSQIMWSEYLKEENNDS